MATKKNTEEEILKSVFITDKDTDERFELDFNRESVKFAEARGFKLSEISEYPATKIPELFWYSFRMHHKRMTQKQTDTILEKMGGMSTALLTRLYGLYAQAGYTNVLNADEDEEKNSVVTVEL